MQRYFKRGDAYVHADLHGASSTIIQNPTPDRPIPPLTLQQVGYLAAVLKGLFLGVKRREVEEGRQQQQQQQQLKHACAGVGCPALRPCQLHVCHS